MKIEEEEQEEINRNCLLCALHILAFFLSEHMRSQYCVETSGLLWAPGIINTRRRSNGHVDDGH